MTGIYVFGINDNVCQQLEKARRRFQTYKLRKYWAITTRVSNEIKGKYNLAMTLQKSSLGIKKVHLSMFYICYVQINYAFLLN